MKVIKRNKAVVDFDKSKIKAAILKAFKEVDGEISEYAETKAENIANYIEELAAEGSDLLTVEEIQDIVEKGLMSTKRKDVAKAYVIYRYQHNTIRQTKKAYKSIIDLVELNNQELKDENSNKNATIASTQRDYMAGEVSKEISLNYLLPKDIKEAHEQGIIHFHDMDYFAQHIHNCCLVNLEDMLQNGTVINKTLIEKPHSFVTACNIATQIMAVIASGQHGGQSISLTHLAPFVNISRQKIRKEVEEETKEALASVGEQLDLQSDAIINKITEKRIKNEINRGVQTIQYQINTLNTSNGQTPFVSIFMYLNETNDPQTKADLALIIEEVLNQRIQGTKNEKGIWITPAFPKLLYVLEEDNIYPESKYWYLTELAAKCTAKRLVPDYISEKMMKQMKLSTGEAEGSGDCYPCMGKWKLQLM